MREYHEQTNTYTVLGRIETDLDHDQPADEGSSNISEADPLLAGHTSHVRLDRVGFGRCDERGGNAPNWQQLLGSGRGDGTSSNLGPSVGKAPRKTETIGYTLMIRRTVNNII